MNLNELINNLSEWLKGTGPDANIIITSRLRIARNTKEFPFPERMNIQQKEKFFQKIRGIKQSVKYLNDYWLIDMKDTSYVDRQFLCERHLISREMMESSRQKGLLLRPDEICSVMLNEEDHLRIQTVKSGFDLQHTWKTVEKIEEIFADNLDFAFSPDFGYLTSCPTNVGTGLRASCMLHLPGLIMTRKINKILELVAKLSFTTRGFFGEGTQAIGNFFQVSNQVTLGASETEILNNLAGIIKQIKTRELEAREYLASKYRVSLEDKIWRALATLKAARIISSNETLSHLSLLRLGSDLGIIRGLDKQLINHLFIMIQPAHLQKIYRKELSHQKRDFARTSLLRDKLKNVSL